MRNFQVNTNPLTTLSYVTPEIYDRLWGGSTSGTPKFYTILANEVSFGPIPATVMQVEMLFYKKYDNLSFLLSDIDDFLKIIFKFDLYLFKNF